MSLLFRLSLLVSIAVPQGIYASQSRLEYLRVQHVDHPACWGRADLDVARDYFVELANELPGVREYNEICRHYQRRQWDFFDSKLEEFRSTHATSPLQAVANFLELQARFEMAAASVGPPNTKNLEKRFQEILLEQPTSELVPPLYVTAGNFWLQQGNYEKSLALYQQARERFPFHSSSCVVLMGIAENRFLLDQHDRARSTFRLVLQKCKNPRLQVGAMIRIADLVFKKNPKQAAKMYEKALNQDEHRFNRFYPHALYNIGELLYRKKQYQRARFYFDEYLKHKVRIPKCTPYAQKRVADVALKLRKPSKQVTGLYMVTREQAPNQNVGRFAYLRGLMLELSQVSQSEYQRRLKIIDAELDRIEDDVLRPQAYIEKGLALLDAGEPEALDYLQRLQSKKIFQLKPKAVAQFVRSKVLGFLKHEQDKARTKQKEGLDDKVLRLVEKVYPIWVKGSAQDVPARRHFSAAILTDFANQLPEDPHASLIRLSQWAQSELWDPKKLPKSTKHATSQKLMRVLWGAKDASAVALAYSRYKKVLDPIVLGSYRVLWLAVAQQLQDDPQMARLAKRFLGSRGPASFAKQFNKSVRDFSLLVIGRAYKWQKRFSLADASFKKVKAEPFLSFALRERLNLYKTQRSYAKAFKVQVALFDKAAKDKQKKKTHLRGLASLLKKGKLWSRAGQVVQLAEKAKLGAAERAPFYYLAGNAYYTQSRCNKAKPMYEKALSLKKGHQSSAEAQYKLGKCLLTLRRPAQAKKVWEDLAKLSDKFWAPLARNELNILSQ